MRLEDLDFPYPEDLIAREPADRSRVLWIQNRRPQEYSWQLFLSQFGRQDVLVVNDTKVVPSRVFAMDRDFEILFVRSLTSDGLRWEVLCPARRLKAGESLPLPEGIMGHIVQNGRPQVMEFSRAIDDAYLMRVGEMPLPPYIQKARRERHNHESDAKWYQAVFAKNLGSRAAPTASLHFKADDLAQLEKQGVQIEKITLHVGLGTFLPIESANPIEHRMHAEPVSGAADTWARLRASKESGKRIWALGTTVTRTLESLVRGAPLQGSTDIFIHPENPPCFVDNLLTNFHQPRTTLLMLVAAFSDLENVQNAYRYAVESRFRLFSYGDLTAWVRK